MKLASAAQMRELDRQAIEERKIPSIDLMDRAAEGVARQPCPCCRSARQSAGRQYSAAAATTGETELQQQESCF